MVLQWDAIRFARVRPKHRTPLKSRLRRFTRLTHWMALASAVSAPVFCMGQVVIDFDTLASPPAGTAFSVLSSANGGSSLLGGVTFDSRFVVVGDAYVEAFQNTGGTAPFAHPHSGHFAVFNSSAQNSLTLGTTQVLAGAWFGSPNFGGGPGGAQQVIVRAMHNATELGSASLSLSGTAMQFLDTSAFLGFSGITGYQIDRLTGTGPYGGGHWVADDFTFAAVPEPAHAVAAAAALCALTLLRRSARRWQGDVS